MLPMPCYQECTHSRIVLTIRQGLWQRLRLKLISCNKALDNWVQPKWLTLPTSSRQLTKTRHILQRFITGFVLGVSSHIGSHSDSIKSLNPPSNQCMEKCSKVRASKILVNKYNSCFMLHCKDLSVEMN